MNTKQILYNALSSQLETKKTQAENYTNEVYNPATDELKNTILEYFENNIGGFASFNFTGNNIRLNLSDNSYYDRVEVIIPNTWRDENKFVQIEWNSGNYSDNNTGKANYLELLNKVYTNFSEISNKYLNEWYPTYINNENKHDEAWKDYKDLKSALDTLQNEIRRDATETMKKIGFEIKSYKPEYNLDWEYNDGNERNYKIKTNNKNIRVQYGRSQYDTSYTNGFKVLGKKGNKYSVELYRENYETRTYNILEKKFETFIEEVARWENQLADDNKTRIEERFESYQK
jgi:hypothetical protein